MLVLRGFEMFTQLTNKEVRKMTDKVRDVRIATIHHVLQQFNCTIDFTGYSIAYYEDVTTDVAYQVVRRTSNRSVRGEMWVTLESFRCLENALEWLSQIEDYQAFALNSFVDPTQNTRSDSRSGIQLGSFGMRDLSTGETL